MRDFSKFIFFQFENCPPLGAHTSIAGGLPNAIYSGEKIGCEVVQLFSKNQIQWKSKPLAEEEVARFKQAVRKTKVLPVVVHDSYLINLASADTIIFQKSFTAVIDELQRCELLDIPYLVMHPGAHSGRGEKEGMNQIADSLNKIFKQMERNKTILLLETTGGQGSHLGYTFEQLKYIIDRSGGNEKIGVCLDTAHIFAAGYDLRTQKSWEISKKQFDKIIGLQKLKIIHANDSKKDLGSRIDRHDRIGKGRIGSKGFSILLKDPDLKKIPFILEIPGGEKAYKEDLRLLKRLRNQS